VSKKISVFLAEDDKNLQMMFKDIICVDEVLELVGISADGISTIRKITEIKPEVLVLDLALPELDGMGVLRKLSESRDDYNPIIIVITANTSQTIAKLAYKTGAEVVFLKPFRIDELLREIKDIIELKKDISFNELSAEFDDIEAKTIRLLNEFGVPSNRVGFDFIIEAMKIIDDNPKTLSLITKTIYPRLSKQFATSASNIERGIRHCIEVAWMNTSEDVLKKLYGNAVSPLKGRPTNTEFLSTIARKLCTPKDT